MAPRGVGGRNAGLQQIDASCEKYVYCERRRLIANRAKEWNVGELPFVTEG
jgi:hypothetical protein